MPVELPNRDLKQFEVEIRWAQDRTALVNCGDIHLALVDFYKDRDAAITGTNN